MTSAPIPDPLPTQRQTLRQIALALDALGALVLRLSDEGEPDPMLTAKEAAAELHVSAAHIRERCRTGALVAMRDGSDYRIRTSALRAYERRRTGK